jgi:beta-lactamase superfamily II metal-dependent hydrolase
MKKIMQVKQKNSSSLLFFLLVFCLQSYFSIHAMISRSDSIVVDQRGIRHLLESGLVPVSVPSKIANLIDGSLYILPFNVGQANFIVLRKNDECVIIDAGFSGTSSANPDTMRDLINDVFTGVRVKAVFLTHPHEDHYNLFSSPQSLFAGEWKKHVLQNSVFYLGGTVTDWSTTRAGTFLNAATKKLYYNDPTFYKDKCINDLITGVSFRIFCLTPPTSGDNKLSLLIQVSFMDKNLLFTGDAEGDSIDRLQATVCNLEQLSDLYKLHIPTPLAIAPAFISKIDELYEKLHKAIDLQMTHNSLFTIDSIPKDIFQEYWQVYVDISDSLVPTLQHIVANYLLRFTLDISRFGPTFQQAFSEYLSGLIASIGKDRLSDNDKKDVRVVIDLFSEGKLRQHMGVSGNLESFYREYSALVLNSKDKDFAKGKMVTLQQIVNKHIASLSQCMALEACKNTDFMSKQKLQIYDTELCFKSLQSAHIVEIQRSLLCEYLNNTLRRRFFANSHLVFIPHHGTHTENSQRFLGFFSGIEGKRAYIVSSSPFGRDHLPKRSTLEMASLQPKHPSHPFIYYPDFAEIGDKASLQMTTKPIYVTGAAPSGYYFLRIVANASSSSSSSSSSASSADIYMYDPYNRGSGTAGSWFNMLKDY